MKFLAALQPNTRLEENTADAWAVMLEAHDYLDAQDAIKRLYAQPRQPGAPFNIELRDIIVEISKVEAQREADRIGKLEPPSEVADDPAAYKRWLSEAARACRRRDWTPPPAIEAGLRHPAVAALTGSWSA